MGAFFQGAPRPREPRLRAAWPTPCRSALRRSLATSCRWPPRRTSTTRSMGSPCSATMSSPASQTSPPKSAPSDLKRAQEVARYVLPLATPAHLYHTINGLTLLRYHVLASQPDVPSEVRAIVDRMLAEVLAVDPYFLGAPGFPLDLRLLDSGEALEAQALEAQAL